LGRVWGTAVMGLTGLLLWATTGPCAGCPERHRRGHAMHFYEAILAALAILVWHLYSVIFDPDVYPLETAFPTASPSGSARKRTPNRRARRIAYESFRPNSRSWSRRHPPQLDWVSRCGVVLVTSARSLALLFPWPCGTRARIPISASSSPVIPGVFIAGWGSFPGDVAARAARAEAGVPWLRSRRSRWPGPSCAICWSSWHHHGRQPDPAACSLTRRWTTWTASPSAARPVTP